MEGRLTGRSTLFAAGRRALWLGFAVPIGAATLIAGCVSEPPGPSINQVEWEVPPVTLEWVGRYIGSASGTFDGEEKEDVEVSVVITFDQPPEPDCSGCITVRVGDFFGQMHLLPQSPISANWSYVHESRRSTLTMQKFSSSAAPGSVFFGTIRVEGQAPDGSSTGDISRFDFVVERQ